MIADALERAKVLIKKANEVEELEGYLATVQEAHAMAAIAQAEQSKRLCDLMEKWMRVQGVEAEFVEAVDRTKEDKEYIAQLEAENHRMAQRISQLEGEPNETGYNQQ